MKTVAIFPVEFGTVKELGYGYLPMNMTEFNWPAPLFHALILTAAEATKRIEK